MNAYELEIIQATLVSQGNLIKQQADQIAELEKDLYMVQRHYDQLNLPDGYVVVCVHCAKELKIDFDEPDDLEAKVKKYEEVLNAIANDYHELSDHKIEVQVRNHKKWAREALSLSGNTATDLSESINNLPSGNAVDLAFRAVYAEQSLKIAEEEAFKAGFRAGFMESGEGFNGEMPDEKYYQYVLELVLAELNDVGNTKGTLPKGKE